MQHSTHRRALAVFSGHQPFEPTEEMRYQVALMVFNGAPEARIAGMLALSIAELRYYFADELGYSQDRLLARCAADVIKLARQERDLGVALKANTLMLQSRLPAWREPKAQDPPRDVAEGGRPLAELTTETLERIVIEGTLGPA